jgi:hypothetical protein
MAKATIEDVRSVFTGMRVSLFAGSVAPEYLKGAKTKKELVDRLTMLFAVVNEDILKEDV